MKKIVKQQQKRNKQAKSIQTYWYWLRTYQTNTLTNLFQELNVLKTYEYISYNNGYVASQLPSITSGVNSSLIRVDVKTTVTVMVELSIVETIFIPAFLVSRETLKTCSGAIF